MRECVRDACVAHHEGVEHAGAVEHSAADDGQGECGSEEAGAANGAGGVGPRAGGELAGGNAGQADGGERDYICGGHQRGGDEHGAGVVALRGFDFLRDGGGVVPAHVVPERDGDGAGKGWRGDRGAQQSDTAAEAIAKRECRAGEGVRMREESLPEAGANEDDEGCEQNGKHARQSLRRRPWRRGGSRGRRGPRWRVPIAEPR